MPCRGRRGGVRLLPSYSYCTCTVRIHCTYCIYDSRHVACGRPTMVIGRQHPPLVPGGVGPAAPPGQQPRCAIPPPPTAIAGGGGANARRSAVPPHPRPPPPPHTCVIRPHSSSAAAPTAQHSGGEIWLSCVGFQISLAAHAGVPPPPPIPPPGGAVSQWPARRVRVLADPDGAAGAALLTTAGQRTGNRGAAGSSWRRVPGGGVCAGGLEAARGERDDEAPRGDFHARLPPSRVPPPWMEPCAAGERAPHHHRHPLLHLPRSKIP